jgi:ribulose-phosphate 3-epimerase
MDGHFVPNITIGPMFVEVARRSTNIVLDVHLMIESPDRYLEDFANAGANILTVHVEACPHLHRTLQHISALGVKPCVALNPATPVESIRHVIDDLAMVLIMSVNPGFGGQSFIHSVLPKIQELSRWRAERGRQFDIEVDGGIKVDNVDVVVAAGANVIVSGSGVFGTPDYGQTISAMRARAQEAQQV